ncbi:hypothetical protein HanHA300_Chr14g0509531 [Helianthus annuus]|nr:hypothetical protein HanHA300_Chr14g0509531 [Helianthus annuus]
MLTSIKTMESRSRAFKNNLLAVVDAIEVIDNMHKENYWVLLKDNPKFLSKGTQCKVAHIFYLLERSETPKGLIYTTCSPETKSDWLGNKGKFHRLWNICHCGIFAMRHMEAYAASNKPLNCGFNKKESEQQEQIKNLRMKYAAKILLSDANLLKRKVIEDARKVANKKKVA